MKKKFNIKSLILLVLFIGLFAVITLFLLPGKEETKNRDYIYGWENDFYDKIEDLTLSDELSMGSMLFMENFNIKKSSGIIYIEDMFGKRTELLWPYVIKKNGVLQNWNKTDYYYDYRDESYKTAVKVHKINENTLKVYYIDGYFYSDKIVPMVILPERFEEITKNLDESMKTDIADAYRLVTKANLDSEMSARIKLLPDWTAESFYMSRVLNTKQVALVDRALRSVGYTMEEKRKIEIDAGYDPSSPDIFIIPCNVTFKGGDFTVEILFDEIYATDESYTIEKNNDIFGVGKNGN